MSREIKFRGKRIDNGEWAEGYYVKHGSRHWIYTGQIQYMYYPACTDLPTKYEVDPSTVGQYIGVDDKNGEEIYEGDIVKTNSGRLCKVVWFSSPQYQGWDLIPIETKNPVPKERELWSDLEVIGNVYENADLLKEVE